MWITPYHRDTDFPQPWSLQDKITIFEGQTFGWLLDIADVAINQGALAYNGTHLGCPILHSGYGVTQMALVYFELIEKAKDGYVGTGRSKHYFEAGVLDLYPQFGPDARAAKDVPTILYRSARCGLYHAGVAAGRMSLSGRPAQAIVYDRARRRITVNPHILVPDMKAHLSGYIEDLRDRAQVDLRTNFQSRFDYLHSFDPFTK